jgi:phytoene dehydrogenase-like protein
MPDAVVVGAGPNGLAAAVTIARAGRSVLLLEALPTVGGGCRTAELTLPGFRHDVCSAIHPLGLASPLLRTLPLEEHGLRWIHSPIALAHPFEDSEPALLERSVEATGATLGRDAHAYEQLLRPFVRKAPTLVPELLGPLQAIRHPLLLARFGLSGLLPAARLARLRFRAARARALFGGLAAHSMLPLSRSPSAAFGLTLALLAHHVGWPVPRGGAQAIADALASYLRSLGGVIETARQVDSLADLPAARAVLLDVTPRQLVALAGNHLPAGYRRALQRYRYGPGVFKLDLALDEPIPWKDEACMRAATIHLGGTMEEIAASESSAWRGEINERPYVLLAQPSLFDSSRAPPGKHSVWAYCHVPNGSGIDMGERIERQIERFAPGFRERILARHSMGPTAMEAYNANYVGGDINGGAQDLSQLFTRPVARFTPYSTPAAGLFLCSSSTPPGGGVHGMCGFWAARAALRGPLREGPSRSPDRTFAER